MGGAFATQVGTPRVCYAKPNSRMSRRHMTRIPLPRGRWASLQYHIKSHPNLTNHYLEHFELRPKKSKASSARLCYSLFGRRCEATSWFGQRNSILPKFWKKYRSTSSSIIYLGT